MLSLGCCLSFPGFYSSCETETGEGKCIYLEFWINNEENQGAQFLHTSVPVLYSAMGKMGQSWA